MQEEQKLPVIPRRGWLMQILGIMFATISAAVPIGGSLAFFCAPLFKKKSDQPTDSFLKITTLDSLPDDGTVQQFPVIKDLVDAWNKFPQTPVGSVFVRKLPEGKLQAFSAMCPHLGCFIQVHATKKSFICPCHNAGFKITGEKQLENEEGKKVENVSPRGMDELEIQIRNNNEIWINYQKFRSGISEKIPTA